MGSVQSYSLGYSPPFYLAGQSYPYANVRNPVESVQKSLYPKPVWQSDRVLTHLPQAGLMLLSGALLNLLTPLNRPGKNNWLATDWKGFAKVGLAIGASSQLNKALGWQPPPWLAGLQTVLLVHPLSFGVTKTSLKQLLVVAPIVSMVVHFADKLQKKLAPQLKEEQGVPTLLTRLMISGALVALSMALLPRVFNKLELLGWLPKAVKGQSGGVMATSLTTCARGCTPGGIICLSELGELAGSMGLSQKKDRPSAAQAAKVQWV